MSRGFTLELLLNTSTSDFAKILCIDEYVAKLVSDAVDKSIKFICLSLIVKRHTAIADEKYADGGYRYIRGLPATC